MSAMFRTDFLERVYAGVLGKLAGVYMGRPVESWRHEAIVERFGMVDGYFHEEVGTPLVVTDDDIAGTFTFLRALEDYGYSPQITPRQIGQTWLNYIIEERTILWWGGRFHSSEHTAYLNLKEGIPAPASGSLQQNGPVIANQIGAQIYIDGWAMVSPGDPERAAELASRAASVSHDDEAVNAARLIAAMESCAFVESDLTRLVDTGLSVISPDSLVYRLVQDLREWHALDQDWRKTRERIAQVYSYRKYIGGCHVIPNHALIHLGLLYGEGDLRQSLAICITSGWDTDCNAGNLGCLLGIRGGLAAFDGPFDWRGPVKDRLFLTSADGGRCITDAAQETVRIVNAARRLNGLEPLIAKKVHSAAGSFEGASQSQGQAVDRPARFHFELPGSLQGWQVDAALPGEAVQTDAEFPAVRLENQAGYSKLGERSLAIRCRGIKRGAPARAASATFILPDDLGMGGYALVASPTLYPGQVVRAGIAAGEENQQPIEVCLYINVYNANDQPERVEAEPALLRPGEAVQTSWKVPDTNGGPIFAVGLSVRPVGAAGDTWDGDVFVDYLTWDGTPETVFTRPAGSTLNPPGPLLFRRAWVNGVDHWEPYYQQAFRIIQNRGRGLISTGTREWRNLRVSARITSAKFKAGGIAARVQGMERYYALLLCEGGQVCLLKALDGDTLLAETVFDWQIWQPYELALELSGRRLRGYVDGQLLLEAEDTGPLVFDGGGVALLVEHGHMAAPAVQVQPIA